MPVWKDGTNSTVKADQDTIENILLCFLNSTNCELFHSVLTYDQAKELGELENVYTHDGTVNTSDYRRTMYIPIPLEVHL